MKRRSFFGWLGVIGCLLTGKARNAQRSPPGPSVTKPADRYCRPGLLPEFEDPGPVVDLCSSGGDIFIATPRAVYQWHRGATEVTITQIFGSQNARLSRSFPIPGKISKTENG